MAEPSVATAAALHVLGLIADGADLRRLAGGQPEDVLDGWTNADVREQCDVSRADAPDGSDAILDLRGALARAVQQRIAEAKKKPGRPPRKDRKSVAGDIYQIRLRPGEKARWFTAAKRDGYASVSAWLRALTGLAQLD